MEKRGANLVLALICDNQTVDVFFQFPFRTAILTEAAPRSKRLLSFWQPIASGGFRLAISIPVLKILSESLTLGNRADPVQGTAVSFSLWVRQRGLAPEHSEVPVLFV
jgi:hypothetical protein